MKEKKVFRKLIWVLKSKNQNLGEYSIRKVSRPITEDPMLRRAVKYFLFFGLEVTRLLASVIFDEVHWAAIYAIPVGKHDVFSLEQSVVALLAARTAIVSGTQKER